MSSIGNWSVIVNYCLRQEQRSRYSDTFAAHQSFARSIQLDELKARLSELPQTKTVVACCGGPYRLMARDAVEMPRKNGYGAIMLPKGVAARAPVR